MVPMFFSTAPSNLRCIRHFNGQETSISSAVAFLDPLNSSWSCPWSCLISLSVHCALFTLEWLPWWHCSCFCTTHMRTAGGDKGRIWRDAFVFARTTGNAERYDVVVNTSGSYSWTNGFEFRLLIHAFRGLYLKLYEYLKYFTSKVVCISLYKFCFHYPLKLPLKWLIINTSPVRIAQSVRRRATGWTAHVQFPAVQDFAFLHSVYAGGPSSLLSNGYWRIFPRGVKRQGRETDHSPPCSVEAKKDGAIPPYAFMAWCLTN
jgi:hypothetical protein